jgi:ABC-type tungstate transport system substrate-binding protein
LIAANFLEIAMAQSRRIVWLNVITVVSAAILIGAEVFGGAFAASWAIATLTDIGSFGQRILDGVFVLCGVAVMVQFVRYAHRIEPFTTRG